MESLKTKYDRILLGLCALIALAIGGLVVAKTFTFEKEPPPTDDGRRNADLGEDRAEDVARTLAALSETVVRKPKLLEDGIEADLMVATPALKTADGGVIEIFGPSAVQLRPPIDNKWLYENDLDITQVDIATEDTDGDGYTNTEEFIGKSNPRNRADTPPAYTKIRYVETIRKPLSLRFNSYNESTGKIALQRVEPDSRTDFNLSIGGKFAHDPRFKAERVEMRDVQDGNVIRRVPFLILTDEQRPDDPVIELQRNQVVQRPTLTAKLLDGLGGSEIIVEEGQEFELPKMPGLKFLVSAITEDDIRISFIPQGGTERTEVSLKLSDN